MKRAVAVAILLALAAPALAQVKSAGTKYSGKDNTPIGFYDQSDDSTSRAVNGLYPLPVVLTSTVHVTSVLSESLGVSKPTDSTSVIPTVNYKSMALMIAPKLGAVAAGTTFRVYVQVRAHRNTTQDSVSTFPYYPWKTASTTLSPGNPALADSIVTTAAPTDDSQDVTEFPISLRVNTTMANPKNLYIELPGFRAPYTSIRFRLADLVGSSKPAVNLWIDAWLVGFDN